MLIPRDRYEYERIYSGDQIVSINKYEVILHDEVITLLPWDRYQCIEVTSPLIWYDQVSVTRYSDVLNWKVLLYALPRFDNYFIYYLQNDRSRHQKKE